MSVTASIIFAVVLYAAFRAATRGKKPDQMAGRLVTRGYALDMGAMKAEGSRQQRERDTFNQVVWDARERADKVRAEELAARIKKSQDQFDRQTAYLRAAGRI
jgi:hypothetical protein